MRVRYLTWEREAFILLNEVASDLSALSASTGLLLESSAKLTVDRSPQENCKSLSIVHGDIAREVRGIRLSGSNTFVFLGQTYLAQQVNQGNFFNPDDVKSQIQAAITIPGEVSLKPLLANVSADKTCALLVKQNFDDQLVVSVDAAVDYISATMLFVFDCVPNADGWSLIGARRAFACNSAYLNSEPKRLVETELTSKIVQRSDMTFKLPLPLVTQASLSFTTLGPIVHDSFVVMVAVSSGVKGYVNQPGCSLLPDAYSLTPGTDLALIFSREACVTLISTLIEKFQADPANRSLLNSGGCTGHIEPTAGVAFSPDDNSLQLVAHISADYNDTAWGIGYHIHLTGTLNVSCSFSTYSDGSALHVDADIATASSLGDVSYSFNVDGPLDVIGKAVDDFTPVVDDKVNSLANDIDLSTFDSIEVGAVPGASKCETIVHSNFLAFEIAY